MSLKKISLIMCSLILFASCEEDDICLQTVTPKLLINIENPVTLESSTVDSIFVDYNFNSDWVRMYEGTATDSIILALPIDGSSQSTFRLYNRSVNTTFDFLELNYTSEENFISKACGFGIIYKNLDANCTTNWLEGLRINTQEITDENQAHLTLLY